MTDQVLVYKRSRFGLRLPLDRVYLNSHYWLLQLSPGVWRVGFTKFATRMLGDIVEYQFDVELGTTVALGQKIGWIEGFKAVSEIYSAVAGEFTLTNPEVRGDITLIESDPFHRGWLYEVNGTPDAGGLDASGYALVLDATIDKLLASRHDGGKDDND